MKRLLCLPVLVGCASASFAEDRFLIEWIDVRKLVHASADVIRTESRLHEGESYAETDRRAASDRVRRPGAARRRQTDVGLRHRPDHYRSV
jgi:hypothetical protein